MSLSNTLNVGGTSFKSLIQTTSRGPAPAADLNVTAKDIVITDGASLSTESDQFRTWWQTEYFDK